MRVGSYYCTKYPVQYSMYCILWALWSNVFPQQEILLAIKIILFVLYMVILGIYSVFMGPLVQQHTHKHPRFLKQNNIKSTKNTEGRYNVENIFKKTQSIFNVVVRNAFVRLIAIRKLSQFDIPIAVSQSYGYLNLGISKFYRRQQWPFYNKHFSIVKKFDKNAEKRNLTLTHVI